MYCKYLSDLMKHAAQSYWLKIDAGIGSTAPPAMVNVTKRVKCILHIIINARNPHYIFDYIQSKVTLSLVQ